MNEPSDIYIRLNKKRYDQLIENFDKYKDRLDFKSYADFIRRAIYSTLISAEESETDEEYKKFANLSYQISEDRKKLHVRELKSDMEDGQEPMRKRIKKFIKKSQKYDKNYKLKLNDFFDYAILYYIHMLDKGNVRF